MRQQKGYIWYDRSRRCWFGCWYQDELQPDGTVTRVHRSKKLADRSDRYRTENDVKPLLDDILKLLNEGKMDARSTGVLRKTLSTRMRRHRLLGIFTICSRSCAISGGVGADSQKRS